MHILSPKKWSTMRTLSRICAGVCVGAVLYSSSLSAQCSGSTSGMSVTLHQTAGGAAVSCVNPDTAYRMQIIGPSGNFYYCVNAEQGFTLPGALDPTRICKDATNGDVLEPFPFRLQTSLSLPASGIRGSAEPNGCATNPFNFSLPSCSGGGGCFNLPSAARAWWKFDESSGSIAIDSVGVNDGTLINGPIRTAGVVSRAMDFDGVNDHVRVPDSSALDVGTGDFSIEAWIRTADSNAMIVSKRVNNGGGNYVGYLFMVNNGRLLVQLADPINSWRNYANLSGPRVDDLQWHHVALTVDRNSSFGGRIYLDGVNIFTFDPTSRSGSLSNSSSLTIGRTSDSSNYFDGQIDEVSLYKKALSPSEVAGIFNAGSSGKCPSSPPPPEPLAVSVACLQPLPASIDAIQSTRGLIGGENDIPCFAATSGGTGNYSYNWSFSGSGFLVPDGPSATIFSCTNGGRVTVTVNDGVASASDNTLVDCGF